MIYLIAVTFILLVSLCFYLVFRRKKYTRERFAFFSTLLVCNYGMAAMLHILGDKSLIYMFVVTFNALPIDDVPLPVTSWSDKAWTILIFAVLVVFVYLMFREWWTQDNSAISYEDFELSLRKRNLNFLKAAFKGMQIKNLAYQRDDQVTSNENRPDLYYLDQTLDWHSEVKDLLIMTSSQYKILDENWHSEESVYLSTYSNRPVIIYCSLQNPSTDSIKKLINKFNDTDKISYDRIIVAVKESEDNIVLDKIDGVTIDYRNKKSMLDSLVDFSDYYNYVNELIFDKEITEGDELTLDDIYVESSGEIIDLKNKKNTIPLDSVQSYILNWVKSPDCDLQVSLLGEYGQGKSVLSLILAHKMIVQKYERIPIIIELRGKSPRNETVASIIASWALSFNINVMAIQKLLQEGRLLVILEGFDELDMVGNALRRLEHFKKLWEFARYKKSKVLITGRPNLFLDNQEAVSYLHLDNDSSNLFTSKAIHLKAFCRGQIENSLRNADERIKNEILSLIDSSSESSSFTDLISRPSTLYQASIIWDRLDKDEVNSATVIDEFIKHAYRRQEEKLRTVGPTGIEPPVLTANERKYFMLGCGVGFVRKNDYSNQIAGDDLKDLATQLFFEIPEIVSNDHPTGLSLKERLKDDPDGIDSVYNDVRTAGILVRDLTGINSFKFAHKSFLELLTAKYVIGCIQKGPDEIIFNSISIALNIEGKLFNLEYSDEVISHITELLLKGINLERDNKHEIASELLYSINPSLKILDNLLFRKRAYFFAAIIGIAITGTLILLDILAGNLLLNDINFIFILKVSFYTSFAISTLLFAKFIIVAHTLSSFNIWYQSCKKIGIDESDNSLISKAMKKYYLVTFNRSSRIVRSGLLLVGEKIVNIYSFR